METAENNNAALVSALLLCPAGAEAKADPTIWNKRGRDAERYEVNAEPTQQHWHQMNVKQVRSIVFFPRVLRVLGVLGVFGTRYGGRKLLLVAYNIFGSIQYLMVVIIIFSGMQTVQVQKCTSSRSVGMRYMYQMKKVGYGTRWKNRYQMKNRTDHLVPVPDKTK